MTGYQIVDGLRVARVVKKRYPDLPIVWGGWHPSVCPDQTISNPSVDIVVRGQGERTFAELVHKLKDDLSLEDVLGITYKHDGKIIRNPDRPFEDINNFPPLPYHLIDLEKYVGPSEFGSHTIRYISSYGCPFNCGFCAEPEVHGRHWSSLRAERVVNDLEHLINKYKIDSIWFVDSNFFVDQSRGREICSGIIERGLNIRWFADGRVDLLLRFNRSTWDLMKKSGCAAILVGAESGSQEVLNLINKGITVEDTIRFAELCAAHGIKIVFSFMLGFPHVLGIFNQTVKEEFNQTHKLINKIYNFAHNIVWFIYTPYPGTALWNSSIQCGLNEPKTLEKWARFDYTPRKRSPTPWVPDKYVETLRILNEYIFPFITGYYLRAFKQKRVRFKFIYGLILKMLHRMAVFRWTHNFFSLLIEHKLIEFYFKLKGMGKID